MKKKVNVILEYITRDLLNNSSKLIFHSYQLEKLRKRKVYETFTTCYAQIANISGMAILILMSKIIFMKYLPPAILGLNWSENYKCSELIEIWHIWYFWYANLDFKVKNYFYQLFTTQHLSHNQSAQNLLKRNLIDNSSMPMLILMWKIIFVKYLEHVRHKLATRLNLLKFSYLIFQIPWSRFWC